MWLLVFAVVVTPALCGRLPYIVNGNDAKVGAWPWQASFQQWNQHICGASLISTKWLVIAAHCVGRPPSDYSVVLGAYDIKSMKQGLPERYSVESITVHPGWVYSAEQQFPNDIALILLKSEAQLSNPYINTIALPEENEDFTENTDCWITGWGDLKYGGPAPDILQELSVSLWPKFICQMALSNYGDWHLCVIKSGSSACQGDSGGPLACKVNNEWKLAGATSFVFGECMTEAPSVYTRISYFVNWIHQTTKLQ